jgi:NhaA family Na+:H+ antiporter
MNFLKFAFQNKMRKNMPLKFIREFLRLEAASGILLLGAAVLALICTNSPLSSYYQEFLALNFLLHLGPQTFELPPLIFWINDGLMAIFFLVVGLELKRSFMEGELADAKKILLPAVAAVGGMLVPALIYVIINHANVQNLNGWSIPVATDIAFALGVLTLFGKRIPIGLKLFLMALAIFDDVGGIIIIAIFYSSHLSATYLLASLGLVFLLYLANSYFRWKKLTPYLLLGVGLWFTILKAGVHPTVAGVLLSFFIPLKKAKNQRLSPLAKLEKTLHPWVAYAILPLFAFTNAGLALSGLAWSSLFDPLVLGIVAGLFIGKQLGVFVFSAVIIKLNFAKLPHRGTWLELYGVALLCGIGFTMSLFLGTLAFQNAAPSYLALVRLGVLLGSILSGLLGSLVFYIVFQKKRKGDFLLEQ